MVKNVEENKDISVKKANVSVKCKQRSQGYQTLWKNHTTKGPVGLKQKDHSIQAIKQKTHQMVDEFCIFKEDTF